MFSAFITLVTVFAVVYAVNLLPAFGPPTWLLLVLFHLHWGVGVPWLVVVGVMASSLGRLCLALGARRLGQRLPDRYLARLKHARTRLMGHKGGSAAALGLFFISPLPSAQLFLAAGLLNLELVPITAAFIVGRLVSYSLYLSLATIAEHSLGSAVGKTFGSPLAIAIQVLFLLAVLALPLIDWEALSQRRSDRKLNAASVAPTHEAPPEPGEASLEN
jgi:membrane protein DedA with SNARE-associated domain